MTSDVLGPLSDMADFRRRKAVNPVPDVADAVSLQIVNNTGFRLARVSRLRVVLNRQLDLVIESQADRPEEPAKLFDRMRG